jgi:hypothetical protein
MLKSANDDTLLPKHHCRALPVNHTPTELRTRQEWTDFSTITIVANSTGWNMPSIERTSACSAIRSRTIKDLLPSRHTLRSAKFQNSQMHLCARLPALVSSSVNGIPIVNRKIFTLLYHSNVVRSTHDAASTIEAPSNLTMQIAGCINHLPWACLHTVDKLITIHSMLEQSRGHFAANGLKLYLPRLPTTAAKSPNLVVVSPGLYRPSPCHL